MKASIFMSRVTWKATQSTRLGFTLDGMPGHHIAHTQTHIMASLEIPFNVTFLVLWKIMREPEERHTTQNEHANEHANK